MCKQTKLIAGPMVLERWGREEVVLTCVLGQKPKLLEIEADCKLLVSPPGHRYDISRILRDERVLQGFGHCEDQSESWTSNLKVIYKFHPTCLFGCCNCFKSNEID